MSAATIDSLTVHTRLTFLVKAVQYHILFLPYSLLQAWRVKKQDFFDCSTHNLCSQPAAHTHCRSRGGSSAHRRSRYHLRRRNNFGCHVIRWRPLVVFCIMTALVL